MRWENWVLDASMSGDGCPLCFCPVEGDLDGDYTIVTGMNLLADKPPDGAKLVAIVHEDGQGAVEEWIERNQAMIAHL
jgi:hypothetical protein